MPYQAPVDENGNPLVLQSARMAQQSSVRPSGVPANARAEMSQGMVDSWIVDNPDGTYTRYGTDGAQQSTFAPGTGGGGFLGKTAMSIAESPVTHGLLKGALLAGTGYVGAGAAGLIGSGAAGTTAAVAPTAGATAGTIAGDAYLPGAVGASAASGSLAGDAYMPGLLGAETAAGGTMATGATLDSILTGASKYAPLIGAVGGALASGDTSTTQSADKSPWGPAQAWMRANLGLGQTMQDKYAANPFNQAQQQAYNNSATGGNQFRTTANSLINQMGQRQAYNRAAPNQVTPYTFGSSNLGMTSMPFPGVK